MLFLVKYQLLCFIVANSVKPQRQTQVTSGHLGTVMLATTVVCGIGVNKTFLGNIFITCSSFENGKK